MRLSPLWLCLILVVTQAGCQSPPLPEQVAKPGVAPRDKADEYSKISDFFIEGDRLQVNGYEAVILKKQVLFEGTKAAAPISFAVLKQQGKVLITFDSVSHPLGTATDFALVSLLNGSHKELVISQTIPRGGRHWVVSFDPEPKVVFDSRDFQLGGEELFFGDLNQDRIAELSISVQVFEGFQNISLAKSPRPEVIFKFNPVTRRYQIANKHFREKLLQGIEDQRKRLDPNQTEPYLATRLGVLLRYVYAGEEARGWAIFDQTYLGNDREEIKKAIKKVLAQNLVYKSLTQ